MTQTLLSFQNWKTELNSLSGSQEQIRNKLNLIVQTRNKVSYQLATLTKQYERKLKEMQHKLDEAATRNEALARENLLYRRDIEEFQNRLIEKERFIAMLIGQHADKGPADIGAAKNADSHALTREKIIRQREDAVPVAKMYQQETRQYVRGQKNDEPAQEIQQVRGINQPADQVVDQQTDPAAQPDVETAAGDAEQQQVPSFRSKENQQVDRLQKQVVPRPPPPPKKKNNYKVATQPQQFLQDTQVPQQTAQPEHNGTEAEQKAVKPTTQGRANDWQYNNQSYDQNQSELQQVEPQAGEKTAASTTGPITTNPTSKGRTNAKTTTKGAKKRFMTYNPFATEDARENESQFVQLRHDELVQEQEPLKANAPEDFFSHLGEKNTNQHSKQTPSNFHQMMDAQESSIDYADSHSIVSSSVFNMLESQVLPDDRASSNSGAPTEPKKMIKKKQNKRQIRNIDPDSFA